MTSTLSIDARQPLQLQLPAPPPRDQRGLKNPLVEGPRNLLHDPPPLPSVEARIQLILDDIDWDAPAITIWVPGTSEYWIKQRFLDELHAVAPGAHVSMVPYESTWRFSTSVPDGVAVLSGVLRAIAKRAKGRPVLLAGESQGAWIISQALTDSALAQIVTRTAIWGHPAAAPQRFGRAGQVREVNAPGDVVTMDLGPRPAEILAGVELLSRKQWLPGLDQIAGYAVQNPAMVRKLITFWGDYLRPASGAGKRNDHDYDDDIANGVQHLLGGLDPHARRAMQRYRSTSSL